MHESDPGLLLRDGADFRQIDKVMEKQFGWPMGPAYLLDVVGIDTAHHAQAVVERSELDGAVFGLALFIDHVDELAVLVGVDGAVLDQDLLGRGAAGDLHAGEQAWGQLAVGIGQGGAHAHAAAAAVELVVDEFQLALVREAFFTDQADQQQQGRATEGSAPC